MLRARVRVTTQRDTRPVTASFPATGRRGGRAPEVARARGPSVARRTTEAGASAKPVALLLTDS
jgi:hypothetical protein